MAEPPSNPERRAAHRADRREDPSPTRRGRRPIPFPRLRFAGREALLIGGAVVAIIAAVTLTRPIFANHPETAARLHRTAPAVAKTVLAPPPDTSRLAQILASPRFEADRRAFAADLVATGRVSQARADSIAFYAVREAYVNEIPPAVVFGVMLTENSRFISGAMSDVGAVGLMQVYPKVWLKALSKKFGKDLATDSTNLKYGVYILKQYIKSDSGAVDPRAVGKGLLRYNGCVLGRHTANCRAYPTKVQRFVEREAEAMCGDKSFYDCIARPFIAGLTGRQPRPPDAAEGE